MSYNTIPSCQPPRVPSCCRSSRPSRQVFHLGPSPFAVYCNARQNKPSYLFVSIADSRSVFISFTMLLALYLSIYLSIHSSIHPPISLSPSKPFYHFLSIIFQPSLLAKYHQLPKFHISSISRRVAVVHLVQQPPDYSNFLESSMNSAFFPHLNHLPSGKLT